MFAHNAAYFVKRKKEESKERRKDSKKEGREGGREGTREKKKEKEKEKTSSPARHLITSEWYFKCLGFC